MDIYEVIEKLKDVERVNSVLLRGMDAQGETIDKLEERIESLETLVRELVNELREADDMVDVNVAAGVAHNTFLGVE